MWVSLCDLAIISCFRFLRKGSIAFLSLGELVALRARSTEDEVPLTHFQLKHSHSEPSKVLHFLPDAGSLVPDGLGVTCAYSFYTLTKCAPESERCDFWHAQGRQGDTPNCKLV